MTGLPIEIATDRDAYVRKLADGFVAKLRDWLSEDQMRLVVDRNAAEVHPNVCHSHDFCDANMAMASALEEMSPEWDFDPNDDEQAAVWNEAWSAAKASGFERSINSVPSI